MGNEFAQTSEWNDQSELDWSLLEHDSHMKMKNWVRDLSHFYKNEPALYENQFDEEGFVWVELHKRNEGILAFKRRGKKSKNDILVVLNISNNNYTECNFHISGKKIWNEIFNSNELQYWGTGEFLNPLPVLTKKLLGSYEIKIAVPALSILIFR
jgi:1,4-alpha-glucan branching enzyme